MANILAARSAEARARGEALMQEADRLLRESWNERMWSDGEPIDPSPTIDQAVNGSFACLEIQCARCKTPSDVDLAAMKHPPTTFVHDLASRLRCRKCAKAGRRPSATLLQLIRQPRHPRGLGCDRGRNHRPSSTPTLNGRPKCRPHPPTSKPSIPSSTP